MIRTNLYSEPIEIDYEYNSGEVVTIPDMALSVRQILDNFTRGSMVPPPIETGDDEDYSDFGNESFDDLSDVADSFNVSIPPATPPSDPPADPPESIVSTNNA